MSKRKAWQRKADEIQAGVMGIAVENLPHPDKDGFRVCYNFSEREIAQIIAEDRREQGERVCEWNEDADGVCDTGCGHAFYFDTASLKDNMEQGFIGCPYCLKRIHIKEEPTT